MLLRRAAQIAVVLGLVAAAVWLVRDRSWERLRKKAEVAAQPAIKPRSAADIIPQLQSPPKRQGVTVKDILAGKVPALSQAEVEAFLRDQGRTVQNLLAASRLLKDLKYAREAAILEPQNPLAQLELALRGETPEEKGAAIAAFRKAAPDNSLGDYLAAHQAFQSGDTGAAGAALLQSLDNPLFADYSQQTIDGSEQAYLNAGYEVQAASVAAMFSLTLERSQTLMGMADQLKGLQDEFIRTADFDAAEPTVIIGLTLGQRIQEQGPYLIDQLMGISIERKFLQQLDPQTAAGPGGQTAAARLETLDANLLEIKTLSSGFAETMATMDDATRSQYLAKMKAEGELAALRWVAARK
ncbi:MAG: hypothetical protein RL639_1380 [Verrucomicrobiota bacterium]|jgi:hypothetical protein